MAVNLKNLAKSSQAFKKLCLNLLFPKRCPFCDKVIGFTECKICENDRNNSYNNIHAPISHDKFNLNNVRFSYAPLLHNDFTKTMLHRLKFNGELHLIEYCIYLMASNIKLCNKNMEYDYIVCVPTKGKEHKNRHNIPLILANSLTKHIDVPFNNNILIKVKNTQRQTSLDAQSRRENVKNAFGVNEKIDINGKKFLIIDDVLTTGSTINDCARALKEKGAIYCDSLCVFVSSKY